MPLGAVAKAAVAKAGAKTEEEVWVATERATTTGPAIAAD